MCCYQLRDIPLDLSQPITGSLASQYWTSSVIGGGPISLVNKLRSTALVITNVFKPKFLTQYKFYDKKIKDNNYWWEKKNVVIKKSVAVRTVQLPLGPPKGKIFPDTLQLFQCLY